MNWDHINDVRLRADAIGFDDGHGMVINTEFVERVAGDGDETEAISIRIDG